MPKRHRVGKSARSVVARIEEIVLASSGADAFDVVLALSATHLANSRAATETRGARTASAIRSLASRTRRAWPWLELASDLEVSDDALVATWHLLDTALASASSAGEVLDAVFEELVTRVGKGQKGQFFTPRHIVDVAVRALGLTRGEHVVDPACGSGAFLTHARACANVTTWGCDVDARAVRVAKLLAVATGERHDARVRADALADPETRGAWPKRIDAILTNPPFAGDVKRDGFALARLVRRAERDAFFLERAVTLLRPGGRLAIVLPHGKVGAPAWAPLRRWLIARARVFAVVSLPRETFLPHTSQRTVLVVARKRARAERPDPNERVLFVASERAGKDASGEPIFKRNREFVPALGRDLGHELDDDLDRAIGRALDHDLDAVTSRLGAFLAREAFR